MEIKCNYCGRNIKRSPSLVRKRNFCNKEHMGLYFKGEQNPNFNNKWNDEQKQKQRELVKEKMNDSEIRYKCGTANRGKKFTKERIEKMHKHRTFESYSRKASESTRKKISKESKAKFTPEFNKKFRQTMEDRGHWVPKSQKTDYQIYMKEANWVERMFDRVKGNELFRLKKHGVYSTNNRDGMVRDHIYSRRSGFNNNVFPVILRHPCNCMIISHKENISKAQNKKINSDAQTFDELISKIIEYKGEWIEHMECIQKITDYHNGDRWERGDA